MVVCDMNIGDVLKRVTTHKMYSEKYYFTMDNIESIALGESVAPDGKIVVGALLKARSMVLIIPNLDKFDDHSISPADDIEIGMMVQKLKFKQ